MPGPWQRRLARVDAIVDRHFSETVSVERRVSGNYGSAMADGFVPFTVGGLLKTDDGLVNLAGDGQDKWSVSLPGGSCSLQVRICELPAGFVFRIGDHVTACDRPGAPRFEVSRVDPLLLGRQRLTLSRI